MIAAFVLAAVLGPATLGPSPQTSPTTPAPIPSPAGPTAPAATPSATVPSPGASPTATAGATPPVPMPAPATPSSATPGGATTSAEPSATPTHTVSPYGYRFVPRQPDHVAPGQPQIFAVYLNDRRLRSRGPIAIRVQTSADVVKVISRNNGREGIIPATAPGVFEATSVLPKIPFIAAGMTVDLEFIATGADGRKTSVRVPVRLD